MYAKRKHARQVLPATSETEVLGESALYPALQRLEAKGWIAAEWGISSNNRKARFYKLTTVGRRQLARQTTRWRKMAAALARVLGPETAGG